MLKFSVWEAYYGVIAFLFIEHESLDIREKTLLWKLQSSVDTLHSAEGTNGQLLFSQRPLSHQLLFTLRFTWSTTTDLTKNTPKFSRRKTKIEGVNFFLLLEVVLSLRLWCTIYQLIFPQVSQRKTFTLSHHIPLYTLTPRQFHCHNIHSLVIGFGMFNDNLRLRSIKRQACSFFLCRAFKLH